MLISIITVNYNDAEGLEKTIQSVHSQTYQDFEHIIIDGNSDDGSKAVIEKYKDSFSYWLSEPDSGIYNAMNKGIDKAKGDYLLFLNSGDWLYNDEVLKEFVNFNRTEDIVYGNTQFINPEGESYLKIMPDNIEGMMIFKRTLNHQATFYKGSLFKSGNNYDESYRMLADWAFYNEVVLIKKGTFKHIDLIVSYYDTTGFSSNSDNCVTMQKERNRFYAKHVDYFIPLLLKEQENRAKEYNNLLSSQIIKKAMMIRKFKQQVFNLFR